MGDRFRVLNSGESRMRRERKTLELIRPLASGPCGKRFHQAVRVGLSASLVLSVSACSFLTGDNGYFRDRSMDYQAATDSEGYRLGSDVPAEVRARIEPIRPVPAVPTDTERFQPESLDDVPRPQVIELVGSEGRLQLLRGFQTRWLWLETDPASAYVWMSRYFNDLGFVIKAGSKVGQRMETSWRVGHIEKPEGEGFWSRSVTAIKQMGRNAVAHERYHIWLNPTSTAGLRGTRVVVMRQVGVAEKVSDLPVSWPDVLPKTVSEPLAVGEQGSFVDYPNVEWWRPVVASLDGALVETADLAAKAQQKKGVIAQVREDGNGWPVLTIDQPFARSWDAIGTALMRLKRSDNRALAVEDLDRTLAVYYIKWQGESSAPEQVTRYQLHVAKGEQGVLVSVQLDDETVAPMAQSELVLSFLKEQLDKLGG